MTEPAYSGDRCLVRDHHVDGGGDVMTKTSLSGGLHWPQDLDARGAQVDVQIPFFDTFAFPNAVTALMLIHYWTALVGFHLCLERLYVAVTERVMDVWDTPQASPAAMLSGSSGQHQFDPQRYSAKVVREVAVKVCRSLDFALAPTVQPDVLVMPLYVVQQYYRDVRARRAKVSSS